MRSVERASDGDKSRERESERVVVPFAVCRKETRDAMEGSYGDGGAQAAVPDLVKQFVVYFYRHIRERNISEIYSMFDSSFNKLSERYFKNLIYFLECEVRFF